MREILGLLGFGAASAGIIILVWYFLQAAALWKIFRKTGEAGWKSLIPWYNEYCLFRASWKNSSVASLYIACAIISEFIYSYQDRLGTGEDLLVKCASAMTAIASVLLLIRSFKEAKAFGKGIGYALGLILLNPVFNLILGFGSAEYRGPQN